MSLNPNAFTAPLTTEAAAWQNTMGSRHLSRTSHGISRFWTVGGGMPTEDFLRWDMEIEGRPSPPTGRVFREGLLLKGPLIFGQESGARGDVKTEPVLNLTLKLTLEDWAVGHRVPISKLAVAKFLFFDTHYYIYKRRVHYSDEYRVCLRSFRVYRLHLIFFSQTTFCQTFTNNANVYESLIYAHLLTYLRPALFNAKLVSYVTGIFSLTTNKYLLMHSFKRRQRFVHKSLKINANNNTKKYYFLN